MTLVLRQATCIHDKCTDLNTCLQGETFYLVWKISLITSTCNLHRLTFRRFMKLQKSMFG